ncbi:membrane protein [Wolbachia endosymbiont of Cylisticus convexus]|uniref:hypothetical protein n=1 Tax=Wolbachia endosymbiont of Cylisticus convexus TaxID=118728 RepID=UPI000E152765|nr:hypothetical protein [Wolbachia endosymbiont of Cylisticus convexus]RDD34362.1 membrane protein [Wolbachia endosymbiont of Cylisticus convexus]
MQQNLLYMTLSLGNSAFFNITKSILQLLIFDNATKLDSLSDINELTLIREQEKVKCMNEVAIATDLSAISVQPTTSEQVCYA